MEADEPDTEEDDTEVDGTEEEATEVDANDEVDGEEEVDDSLPEVADGDVIVDVPEFDPENIDPEFVAICERFSELENAAPDISDPAENFTFVAEGFQELSELSPDPDLADDLLLVSSASAQLAETFSAEGIDFLDPTEEVLAATEAVVTPEVEAASNNIEETLDPICGTGDGSAVATLDETVALDGPGESDGSIAAGTYDLYEIDVPAGTALTVTMEDASNGRVDPLLAVTDPDGADFSNDDADGAALADFDSQLVFDDAIGGTYMIEARSFQGNSTGDYTLTVEFG